MLLLFSQLVNNDQQTVSIQEQTPPAADTVSEKLLLLLCINKSFAGTR